MTNETLDTNLLRWISAELYFSLGMQAAREMFGKSYFSLGVDEKIALNNAVGGSVRGNYQAMNLDFLIAQEAQKTPQANSGQEPTKGKQPVGFSESRPEDVRALFTFSSLSPINATFRHYQFSGGVSWQLIR